jgi:glycosyltransferase involved in cell wall biosynthesis
MKTPFVSIIIPVYNDAQRLKSCLEQLQNQSYPQDCYEIIVVDNNSTEDLQPVVTQFSQATYTFEATPGSYSARNHGIALARGDILGFTDSDCVPAPDWIEKGVCHILKHPDCGFVAGRIQFFFKDPDNPTPAELYYSLHNLRQEKYVEEGHFGATANLFTTPKIFQAVGLFTSPLQSGGDRDWGKRVYAAGYPQIYAEDVEIAHPARFDFTELSKKTRRTCEGIFIKSNTITTPLPKFLIEILNDIKPPIRYLLEILKDTSISGFQKRLAVIYIYICLRLTKAIAKLWLYWKGHLNPDSTG